MSETNLTKFRKLYEFLVRFDGEVIAGAHAAYIEGISEGGVILQSKPGPAIPLSLLDEADKATVKKVIGETTFALIIAKEEAEADARAARAEFEAKDANIQDLLGRLAKADPELEAAREDAIALRHEVLTLRAEKLGTEPPPSLEEWKAALDATDEKEAL